MRTTFSRGWDRGSKSTSCEVGEREQPPSWRRNRRRRRRKWRKGSVLDFIMIRLYASIRVCMGGRNIGKDIPERGMRVTRGQSEGNQDGKQRNCPSSENRTLLYDLEWLPGSLTTSILFYELDLDRIARFSHGNDEKIARSENDSIVHWLIMVRLFDDIWIRWPRWEKMWILCFTIMDG